MFSPSKPVIATVAATLIIFLFVYTASSKLMHLSLFQSTLSKSPLLHFVAPVVAIAVPVIELVIAFLLLFPKTKQLGFQLAFALMLLFTVYISFMLAFAYKLPCSCGGVLRSLTWRQHLLFNAAFVLLAWAGMRSVNKSDTPAVEIQPT